MTKRQDLCLQRCSRPEQSDQRQPNQAANISHQPRASPDSISLASRIEFPTMTAGFHLTGRPFGAQTVDASRPSGGSTAPRDDRTRPNSPLPAASTAGLVKTSLMKPRGQAKNWNYN